MNAPAELPLTVLAGYLGAGKTTLLGRLLRAPHGRRIGILVNDFGAVGLDASLLEDAAAETVELVNGCVCCALADDLGRGLETLRARRVPLDQVILEASGVADPNRLAALADTWPGYRHDATLVCVDATRVQSLAVDRFVGTTVRRQLAAADLVILTHVDEPHARERLETWLDQAAPGIARLTADHALPLLLDAPHSGVGTSARKARGNDAAEPAHAPRAHFETWSERIGHPVDRARIDAIMAQTPSLLRAKGELWLNEAPDRRFVLQRVGARWEIIDTGPWGIRSPGTRIDCIAVAQP